MALKEHPPVEIDNEGDEQDVAHPLPPKTVAAVVSGNDWTTETIVSQLKRGNIQLTPRFQRRDAWQIDRKSRFIESLLVGLPIPQIVLAESQTERGKFIVLDGKQRLLAILQFWGSGSGPNNAYPLSGLTIRKDLAGLTFGELSTKPTHQDDYNQLCNQSIRTVVIRNWRDTDFLHTVFLRLNTGSVNLSPQELRQALLPGEFSDFIDDAAGSSAGIRLVLGSAEPDPRMRDIEILARFLGFHFFAKDYPGRMKRFLDATFSKYNDDWANYKNKVKEACEEFEAGVADLNKIFGSSLARKPTSPQFNRAIFDALIYYHSDPTIRKGVKGKHAQLKKQYEALFSDDSEFAKAIESDTAGAPNTLARLKIWAAVLSKVTGAKVSAPAIPIAAEKPSASKKSKET
jgi:hypothetical protein